MTVTIGHLTFDNATYDERGDILYLHVGERQAAADSEETPEGHVLRFDATGKIIGLTIINAKWLLAPDRHRKGDGGGDVRFRSRAEKQSLASCSAGHRARQSANRTARAGRRNGRVTRARRTTQRPRVRARNRVRAREGRGHRASAYCG